MELAEQYMSLFEGLGRAYGTFAVKDTSKTKHKGVAQTIKGDVSVHLWMEHLGGKKGLGIVPINDENNCRFGAIDIDEYDISIKKIIHKLRELKVKVHPCRSKSGGLHVYLFTSEWVPAELMRNKLEHISAMIGFGGSEIFPKQSKILAARGDIGSWINMPYFNRQDTTRYGYAPDCSKLASGRFVELALKNRYNLKELQNLDSSSGNECSDGPPCLQHLCNVGFPEGSRNDGLFNIGVYLRKSKPDTWKLEVEKYNHKYFKPPLLINEVKEVIKSVAKKDYIYTCARPPISLHCNISTCRTRKFGVGSENALPNMHSLTKFNTDPPIWFLDVDGGGRLELTTDDLQIQKRFQRRCIDCLNIMPTKIKENEWASMVNTLLEKCNIIEAPPDSSLGGQLMEHVYNFISQRAIGLSREELVRGKPVYLDGYFYFRIGDLCSYLERHNFRDFKVNKVTSILRQNGAEHHFFQVEGKGVNCWKLLGVKKPITDNILPTELDDGQPPF